MPPHRDWTRRGVGRALLWWPFTAFLLVAVFPAAAVPAMVGSGVVLVAVGLVGGALGRRWRARRLRREGRTVGAVPRTVAEGSSTAAAGASTDAAADATTGAAADATTGAGTGAATGPVHETPPDSPDDEGPEVRAA